MSTKRFARLMVAGVVAAGTALSGVAVAAAPAAAAGPPRCTASQLTGRFVGPHEGAAGTTFTDVRLTNVSNRSCTLKGFPRARFLHYGNAVGAPSSYRPYTDSDGKVHTGRVLLPRHTGRSFVLVGIADAGNFGSGCHPLEATALRLVLPHGAGRVRVPFGSYDVQACANKKDAQLSVSQFLRHRTTPSSM